MIERWDATLLLAWLALVLLGLVLVGSAAGGQVGGADYYLGKQLLFTVAALVGFAVLAAVPLAIWERFHRPCLLLAIALCALVLLPGLSVEVKGARRWIDLGVMRFQPAEAAKLLVVVYLAGYVAQAGATLTTRWAGLLRPLAWVGGLLVLILLQPDFGTIAVLAAVAAGMLFLGGARVLPFILAAVLGGLALAVAAVLDPYRVARLQTFLDPWATQFDGGYQLTQALIAFGRGEFFGLGLGEGVQKLDYLPEAHNDFIYAVIVEELGMVGGLAVLALLAFLALRMLRIGHRAVLEQRVFAGIVAYGAALLIAVQTVVNVGVNTGVLPTKGLTLPFLSFGGNSLLVCSGLVALASRAYYEGAPAGRTAAAGVARG